MIQFCKNCILPDTRPALHLKADGVCNACHSYKERAEIDWKLRERAFFDVVQHAKKQSRGYDCLIPVSGGKDSIWQTRMCLDYGLKPLCVTWKTPVRTKLGQHNLDALVAMGVDHIDFQVSPHVEKKFLLRTFERFGSTAIPMHMAIFNIPLTIAARFSIPLVVWGENSAFEYGGAGEERTGFRMTTQWLKKYGVTHGTSAEDWIDEVLSRKELAPYFGPSSSELEHINAIFLGYYFPWDPETSLIAAKKEGFHVRVEGPKLGLYNYADIDDDFIAIHHWLKWYKFGFTRLFDNLSLEIRNSRMTRDNALDTLMRMGEERPDGDIDLFCKFVDISREKFNAIAETWRNRDIWYQDHGVWKIHNFLVPDWNWV